MGMHANLADDVTNRARALPRRIVDFLNRQRKPLTLTRIAAFLDLDVDAPNFLQAIITLRREGALYADRGFRYASTFGSAAQLGTLRMSERGYGFVRIEGDENDIHVPADSTGDAIDGDLVLVTDDKRRARGDLRRGRVLGVADRPERTIVGTYQEGVGFAWIRPARQVLADIQLVGVPQPGGTNSPRNGDRIVGVLEPIMPESAAPFVRFSRTLGNPADPWVDIESIVYEFGLPASFAPALDAEAALLVEVARGESFEGRRDLRTETVITIDPADAADIDDAVSLTRDAAGNDVVGIHIADVSHYVALGSGIDQEAARRGTSVYLPGRVIHMLPGTLSAGLCSLQPGADRLTMSVFVTLNNRSVPVATEYCASVIRSSAQLSYEQVQEALDDTEAKENPARAHVDMLQRLAEITGRMTTSRIGLGALDFDIPEVRVEVNADGRVETLRRRERLVSHRIVEELMLLANRVVAEKLAAEHYSLLYRVHSGPDPQKLRELEPLALSIGQVIAPEGQTPTVRDLQSFLDGIRGNPIAPVLESLVIRSLPKAVYQPDNIGHFGLAAEEYTHFTSPIRRYPDIVVHRQLKRCLAAAPPTYEREHLVSIGQQCSAAEQNAAAAEREAIRAKQVEYLACHIGEEFEGRLSGVRKFGLFVMLDESLAEGFVPVADLPEDFYTYDADALALYGRKTRAAFRFGDPVTVQVVRADLAARRVDFLLVATPRAWDKRMRLTVGTKASVSRGNGHRAQKRQSKTHKRRKKR
jgi:ribonuclease R